MKRLKTNKYTYYIEVRDGGRLFVTKNLKTQSEYKDTGLLVTQYGGVEKVLEKCSEEDLTAEEWMEINRGEAEKRREFHDKLAAAKNAKEQEKAKHTEEVFIALKEKYNGDAIPATYENICKVINYLHHNGIIDLPAMTIGYTCNQYECGDRYATAMKFDEPITFVDDLLDDEEVKCETNRFVIGAPKAYLTKYHHIFYVAD